MTHNYKDSILATIVALLVPLVIIYGLYVQWHGDYSPGGGFQAGVIVASGFIICFLSGSGEQFARCWFSIARLCATAASGVLLYVLTGLTCVFFKGQFLEYKALPISGASAHHLGMMSIELGVGITVSSVMLILYFAFHKQQDKLNA